MEPMCQASCEARHENGRKRPNARKRAYASKAVYQAGRARPGPARKNRRRKYSPGRLGSPGAAELDGSYVGMRCGGLPGRTAVEYSNTPVSGRIAEDFSGPVYVA